MSVFLFAANRHIVMCFFICDRKLLAVIVNIKDGSPVAGNELRLAGSQLAIGKAFSGSGFIFIKIAEADLRTGFASLDFGCDVGVPLHISVRFGQILVIPVGILRPIDNSVTHRLPIPLGIEH